MAANGRLPASDLAPIYGGRLRKDAAAAWNAMDAECVRLTGKHLRPTGSQSSYRDYDAQVYFWNLYISGKGNLAAHPGTSNHGWGIAVDLAEPWMRSWVDAHGAKYGWKKTEAFGEWWHVNYVGGFKPEPPVDHLNGLTKKERALASKLIYHRHKRDAEAKSGKGPKYFANAAWARYYKGRVNAQRQALARDAKKTGWKTDNRGVRYQILSKVWLGKIN